MDDGFGRGRIEVIAGPMFAGKSEELVRRVRRAQIARRGVAVVSHELDTREGTGRVTSHSGLELPSRTVDTASSIPGLLGPDTELVAVDEAQFFGDDLVPVASVLAGRGLVVVVAGLSVTFDGRPFAPMPALMALAESVDKLTAVCVVCGAEAAFHIRVPDAGPATPGDALTPVAAHVGGAESYEARCRRHR
ncbi:thymidine kinase [Myceligenerans pegani]|uniref:Thymidine kinase n=1 Tax=Myceligenerans pegani TaxID=2776917 RepID=A0ABR9N5C2_9MICO|nr:thymidine kinase [Myceligenerans sp. TRM 65318]MBE1878848.1 thymidine kinase [Myceligenerans sp. TRM 65318]MBE3021119.1 thymidine kinase [Myceligenerans sp. TRM 65318]